MKGARYVIPVLIAVVVVLVWAATHRGEPAGPAQQEQPQAVAAGPPEGEAGLSPVELDLPEPMFTGTPKPINVQNVEKPRGKPRPPFLAPAGTVNLAAGKPVSSSDPYPVIGELELITDGDKEATFGTFVELGPGRQWAQIDLEQRCTIYAVVVWHYHAEPRVYSDVIVQVGDDPDFAVAGGTTAFNNDHDNSSGMGVGEDLGYVETFEGKLVDCGGAEGRYVRLYSSGNSANEMNHYTEVEVYGQPPL